MLLCPKCESSLLHERERGDIVVDACRECGGIWLDRGELERIVAEATHAGAHQERLRTPPPIPHDRRDAWTAPPYHGPPPWAGADEYLSEKEARKLAKKRRKNAKKRRHPPSKKERLHDFIGDIFD